jgi:hypothetical protein
MFKTIGFEGAVPEPDRLCATGSRYDIVPGMPRFARLQQLRAAPARPAPIRSLRITGRFQLPARSYSSRANTILHS